MVVFDTNLLIDYLYGDEKSIKVVETYLGMERLSITCINEYELFRGVDIAGEELLNMLLSNFNIYYLEQDAIKIAINLYKKLKKNGKLIDDADILIASIASANNEVLVTEDDDFERLNLKNVRVIK